jgi:hypothetical protein
MACDDLRAAEAAVQAKYAALEKRSPTLQRRTSRGAKSSPATTQRGQCSDPDCGSSFEQVPGGLSPPKSTRSAAEGNFANSVSNSEFRRQRQRLGDGDRRWPVPPTSGFLERHSRRERHHCGQHTTLSSSWLDRSGLRCP